MRAILLLLGIGAAIFFVRFTRSWDAKVERRLLAASLVGAALLYVFFAITGYVNSWIAIELIGAVPFLLFADLGVRRSILWLATGWALHPLWDAGLHLSGMGYSVAPSWYALTCTGFDLFVCWYIVFNRERLEEKSRHHSR